MPHFFRGMELDWWVAGILLVVNLPVYWLLTKVFFKDFDGFLEAVMFWFTPDLWSMLTDRFLEDMWAEIRLSIWLALCSGLLFGEYYLVQEYVLSAIAA